MEKKKIKQLFIRFLKERCALTDFRTHIGNWDSRPFMSDMYGWCGYKHMVDSLQPDDWINLAFAWEDTELGRSHWLYLSNEWATILQYLMLHN